MAANNQIYFNPNKSLEIAKLQGNIAGREAGHPDQFGVAAAPTSIYNQGGYYAMHDTESGSIYLQKMHPDSIYTSQWYDQGSQTIYDFGPNGKGIQPAQNNNTNQVYSDPYINAFPYQNMMTINPSYAAPGQAPMQVDSNGNPITLDADDVVELVDAGVYDSNAEALNDLTNQGYTVEDSEQAKLDIYTDETEEQIGLLMDKLGISREEAIAKLGNKAVTNEQESQFVEQEFNNMLENGASRFEAYKKLTEQGYEVSPDFLKTYDKGDLKQIEKYMEKYGCSKEEAAEALNIKPNNNYLIKGLESGIISPEQFVDNPKMFTKDMIFGAGFFGMYVDQDRSIFGTK